jgi:DNA-binding response OmpR family regulator
MGQRPVTIERRLLSVDDDPAILALIGHVAKDLGFAVEGISDSHLFRETYYRFNPTVITLDIFMPTVDGIELILWLAEIGSTAHVVIISGANTRYLPMAEEIARERGTVKISQLAKPFGIDSLRAALVAYL